MRARTIAGFAAVLALASGAAAKFNAEQNSALAESTITVERLEPETWNTLTMPSDMSPLKSHQTPFAAALSLDVPGGRAAVSLIGISETISDYDGKPSEDGKSAAIVCVKNLSPDDTSWDFTFTDDIGAAGAAVDAPDSGTTDCYAVHGSWAKERANLGIAEKNRFLGGDWGTDKVNWYAEFAIRNGVLSITDIAPPPAGKLPHLLAAVPGTPVGSIADLVPVKDAQFSVADVAAFTNKLGEAVKQLPPEPPASANPMSTLTVG